VDRDGGSDVGAISACSMPSSRKNHHYVSRRHAHARRPPAKNPSPESASSRAARKSTSFPRASFGSFEAFDRRGAIRLGSPVTVVFGKPLPASYYDDPSAGKERYQIASERIMAEIAKLQPPPVTII